MGRVTPLAGSTGPIPLVHGESETYKGTNLSIFYRAVFLARILLAVFT